MLAHQSMRTTSRCQRATNPLPRLILKAIFNSNSQPHGSSMYICLCLGVTDRQIDQAIDAVRRDHPLDRACTVAEVMSCSGAGTRCGACRPEIAQRVAAAQQSVAPS